MKNILILLLFFSVSMSAQNSFITKDYFCTYQGKIYTMNIGVFSPNDDGSILIRCEKPNRDWNIKSYSFHAYVPMGYLFIEKGNSGRRVIIEKDRYENITSIVFLYSEEKIIYKPKQVTK